jgi:dTDP-glucose 4,6-dehydratase
MNKKKKTLLILGGSGFVGKSILNSFINNKIIKFNINKIIIVSRNPKKLKKELAITKEKNIFLKKLDLFKAKNLPSADYIIHAAEKTINDVIDKKLFTKYHKLTKKIIDYYSNFNNIKFLYLSSGAVYGKISYKKKPKETDKTNYKNLKKLQREYSKNKIKSEKYLLKKFKKDSFIIARLFSFMGKYTPRNGGYAIGNFLNSIEKSKNIVVKSSNPNRTYRSYLYSDDLVECLMQLLTCKNLSKNSIYNIGSDNHITIKNLSGIISKNYNLSVDNVGKFKKSIWDYYVPNIEKYKKNFKNTKFLNINVSISKSINRKI